MPLNYAAVVQLHDKVSKPAKQVAGSVSKMAKKVRVPLAELGEAGAEASEGIAKAQVPRGTIPGAGISLDSAENLKTALADLSDKLEEASEKAKQLAIKLKSTEKPTQGLIDKNKKARAAVNALKEKQLQQIRTMDELRRSISSTGVPMRSLTEAQRSIRTQTASTTRELEKQQTALDKLEDKQRQSIRTQERLASIQAKAAIARKHFGNVKNTVGQVGGAVRNTALVAGGYAAAGGGILGSFAKTAGMYEDQLATLKVLENGNLEKAKQSLGWIEQFAMKTPYELHQVNDAFIKLRAYGIDPIKSDTLRVLGDTAAGMGKDVIDAVEAIADAVVGENERLKEFGIKAKVSKDTIEYRYADKDGKEQIVKANKNSQAEIQATLLAIWNQKYAGAMAERSKTWNGMWSNMKDYYAKFQNMVMNSGVFDYLKDQMRIALAYVQWYMDRGDLKRWAREASDKLIAFAKSVKTAGKKLWELAKSVKATLEPVARFVGGWDNLIIGFAGLMILAPVISSIAVLVGSLVMATVAMKPLVLATGAWKLTLLGVRAVKMTGFMGALITSIGVQKTKTIALTAALKAWKAALAIGSMASGGLSGRIGSLKGAFGKLSKVLPIVKKGLMVIARLALLNPIGLIVTAVVGAAYLIYKNWNRIIDWWNGSKLKELAVEYGVLDYAKEKARQLMDWWNNTSFIEKGFDIATWPLQVAKTIAEDLFNWWKGTKLGEKSIEILTDTIDYARNKIQAFKDWWDGLSLKSLVAGVKTTAKNIGERLFGGGEPETDGERAYGGPVKRGGLYRVAELGPEIFQTANRTYMIAANDGHISPLKQVQQHQTNRQQHQQMQQQSMIRSQNVVPIRSPQAQMSKMLHEMRGQHELTVNLKAAPGVKYSIENKKSKGNASTFNLGTRAGGAL